MQSCLEINHIVSNTAWRGHARLRSLWRDVDHPAARRNELQMRCTGIFLPADARKTYELFERRSYPTVPLGITNLTIDHKVMEYLKEPSQRAARWIRRAILETTTLDGYDDTS